MKTIIKVDKPAKFFERGRAAARLVDQGKAIPLERVIAFEDPEDMARLITTGAVAPHLRHRDPGKGPPGPERALPRARPGGRLHRRAEALHVTLPAAVATAARAGLAKKAEAVVALDLRSSADFTDFFLVLSGQSQRQLVAIADVVVDALRAQGRRPAHVEGYPRQEWILLDYGGFVVHLMTPRSRSFYDLERLWGGAKRLEVAG